MKKLLLSLALVMALGLGASAQRSSGYFSMDYETSAQNDGFFSYWNYLNYGTSAQYGGVFSGWNYLDYGTSTQNDGFYSSWNEMGNGIDRDPGIPGHGGGDTPAPLGGGALLLVGFGAAYALKKRSEK